MITPCPGAQKLLATVLREERDEGFFLFTGAEGVDLEKSALNFFKAASCRRRKELEPGTFCGECLACKEIERRIYPDLMIIQLREEKAEISIDEFEPVKHFTLRIPHYGKRYLIVLNAEELSRDASTTALKILEEPKSNTSIVFLAHHPWMLPPTIRSRAFEVAHRPTVAPEVWQSENAAARFWDGRELLLTQKGELFRAMKPVAEEFFGVWRTNPSVRTLVEFTEKYNRTPLIDDAEALELFFRMLCALWHDEEIRARGGDVRLLPQSPDERAPERAATPLTASKAEAPARSSFEVFERLYDARNLLQTTYVNRRVLLERTFAELLPG